MYRLLVEAYVELYLGNTVRHRFIVLNLSGIVEYPCMGKECFHIILSATFLLHRLSIVNPSLILENRGVIS